MSLTVIFCHFKTNAFQVDVFESVVRWIQSEIERRLRDSDAGQVADLREVFDTHFKAVVRFEAFTSQVRYSLKQKRIKQETANFK